MLENTSIFVTQLFAEKLPVWAVYHDLTHTIETVNACLEIGRGSDISEEDLEILCIASWFHDTGYLYTVDGHEEKSSEIALNFLKENYYSSDRINTVVDCILATKIDKNPRNLLESIICDSDLITLGKQEYFGKNNLLKFEIELRDGKKISEFDWLKRSHHFLSLHKYFTEYAQINFNPQLEINRMTLQKKIDDYRS